MSFVRMVQTYPTLTGLSKDVMTNTLHFESGLSATAIQVPIWSAWSTFLGVYDAWCSSSIYEQNWHAEFFDMEDPEPRIPIGEATFNGTLSASASLPLECSPVVSFAGPEVSGVNMARRRGRIFLPAPVVQSIVSSAGKVTWSTDFVTAVRNAFSTFANTLLDNATTVFVDVYSPTTHDGGSSLVQAMTPITRGWVDNEPDTQRRRGGDTGTKSAFTVV